MSGFDRHFYPGLVPLFADLQRVITHRRAAPFHQPLPGDFRERLFLAVTAVNNCRYCSFVHARLALIHGISPEEIRQLNDGLLSECPPEQLPALLYAQHWAESNACPDSTARLRLQQIYGPQMSAAIELAVEMIGIANLLGNTLDYVLYRLSGNA
jgi:AhpD family alkylhydroperoxidase